MVYDRTHTRELPVLEGMGLSKALPFAAVTFVIASLASMGLPGFSGFVAELQVLIGAWQAFPVLAIGTGFGILVGVIYALRVLQQAFFGEAQPLTRNRTRPAVALEPITVPERLGAILLIGATLAVGLYPRLLLDLIVPALDSELFVRVVKGGGL
jgi:NADH-quinone oxidoreductase subunit M